jgi:putative transposase
VVRRGGRNEGLVGDTDCAVEVDANELTVHADRCTAMRSKLVAQLFADVGVTKTHSRTHVSFDTPSTEGPFKTLKYRRGFPARFSSIEDICAISCRLFRS